MRFVRAFALNDLRNIPREPLMVFMLLTPWVYVIGLRLVLPVAGEWLMAAYGVSVADYYPLIMTAYTLPIPLFIGIVYGLLLLDERDDQVFPALQVTRVSLEAYMVYRVVAAVCISIPYSAFYAWATGLVPPRAVLTTLPALVLGAVVAVFTMLSLVAFASNKVEGLALLKVLGTLMTCGTMVAFFWRSPWQLVLGIIPSYWPAKAYWLLYLGEPAWGYIAAGSVYGLLLCAALYSVILRKIRGLA
jgi:fluoroquinolone transport system permease protein